MWCELSFVLSRPSFQFATVQSQIYWRLLKTVLSCHQSSSHSRHGEDNTLVMLHRLLFIVKCNIVRFLCAMHVFEVRASSSSTWLPCAKFRFFHSLHCWASPWRKLYTQSLNQLIHQSITQLIWCPENRSLHFKITRRNITTHNRTKLHQFLTSSFKVLTRTERQTWLKTIRCFFSTAGAQVIIITTPMEEVLQHNKLCWWYFIMMNIKHWGRLPNLKLTNRYQCQMLSLSLKASSHQI